MRCVWVGSAAVVQLAAQSSRHAAPSSASLLLTAVLRGSTHCTLQGQNVSSFGVCSRWRQSLGSVARPEGGALLFPPAPPSQEMAPNSIQHLPPPLQWRPGDIIFADNRAVAHLSPEEAHQPREQAGLRVLHRVLITGPARPWKSYKIREDGSVLDAVA